jgi:hypothetical protein
VDLATANFGINSVSYLRGDGAGGLLPRLDFTVGVQPRALTVGDYNNDQNLDLATANSGDDTVSVLLNALPDITPPTVTVTSGPVRYSTATSASFTFVSDDVSVNRIICRIKFGDGDFNPWSDCSSPTLYPSLADGNYWFQVAVRDPAGNWGMGLIYRWTVDRTPPVLSFEVAPSGFTRFDSPVFDLAFSEPLANLEFECQIDGGGFSPCEQRSIVGPLIEGTHTFQAKATDRAGNNSNLLSRTFTVDITRPDTTMNTWPAGTQMRPSALTSASFTFSSDEPGSTFECRIDDEVWSTAACLAPKVYTGLADGRHQFWVRAVDPAGNRDGTAATKAWWVKRGA